MLDTCNSRSLASINVSFQHKVGSYVRITYHIDKSDMCDICPFVIRYTQEDTWLNNIQPAQLL